MKLSVSLCIEADDAAEAHQAERLREMIEAQGLIDLDVGGAVELDASLFADFAACARDLRQIFLRARARQVRRPRRREHP